MKPGMSSLKHIATIPMVAISLSLFSILTGCSLFTPPLENPLLTDYQKEDFYSGKRTFGSSSLTASRRMVLFKLNRTDIGRICAEPPPTVGDELSKAIQGAITASVNVAEDKGEGSASLARTLTTTLKQLQKPRGIQYEQDELFWLCQMYMNNGIDSQGLFLAFNEVSARAERILLAEIGASKNGSEDQLVAITRRLKSGEAFRAKVNNGARKQGYNAIALVIRKASPDQAENEGWVEISNKVVSDSTYSGTLKDDVISQLALSGNEIIEIALAITPTPTTPKEYLIASEKAVYYQNDGDKASLLDFDSNVVKLENKFHIKIKLPAYSVFAYPNFNPLFSTLSAKLNYNGKTVIPQEVRFAQKEDNDTYKYDITLKDEDLADVYNARGKSNVVLSLEFQPMQGEAPRILTATINRYNETTDVQDFAVTAGEQADGKYNVNLGWKVSTKNVTNFKVSKIKEGAEKFEDPKVLGPDLLSWVDKVTETGKYTYRIQPFYYSREGTVYSSTVQIPEPKAK